MQRAANVTSGDVVDWHAIDWKHVYRTVKNLRQRIFRASRDGRSETRQVAAATDAEVSGRTSCESVRRVTQVNQGKDTPGVDQVVVTTPEERGRCASSSANSIFTRFTPSVGSISPSGKANVRWAFPPSSIDVSKPW